MFDEWSSWYEKTKKEELEKFLEIQNSPDFKKFSKKVQHNINLWVRMYQGDTDALMALSIQYGLGKDKGFKEPEDV